MPQEYVLKDGQIIRRTISENSLGSADLLLSTMVEPIPTLVPDVFSIGDTPVHMATSPQTITLAMRIPNLPFCAQMELSSDGKYLYMPDCNYFNLSTERREAVTVNKPYSAPLGGSFNLYVRFAANGNLPPSALDAHVVMRTQSGAFLAPYYPNVYDNGRICMGNEWEAEKNRANGLMQKFISAYSSFMTSKCSSHLINNNKRGIFNLLVNPNGEQGEWQRTSLDPLTYGAGTGLSFATQMKELL